MRTNGCIICPDIDQCETAMGCLRLPGSIREPDAQERIATLEAELAQDDAVKTLLRDSLGKVVAERDALRAILETTPYPAYKQMLGINHMNTWLDACTAYRHALKAALAAKGGS